MKSNTTIECQGIQQLTADRADHHLTIDRVVEDLASNKTAESLIKQICPQAEIQDLANDVYLQLLENPEKTLELHNKDELIPYITGIIKNSVFSTTSEYHNKYIKMRSFKSVDDLQITNDE